MEASTLFQIVCFAERFMILNLSFAVLCGGLVASQMLQFSGSIDHVQFSETTGFQNMHGCTVAVIALSGLTLLRLTGAQPSMVPCIYHL